MKVLVTGGSGFLGSHVADALTAAGHEVVVVDVKPSPWLQPTQQMKVGSVLDIAFLREAAAGCSVIYHLAAQADIDAAMTRPHDTVEINVMGTLNALSVAHELGMQRFVFASSIYVYSTQGSFYRTTKQAGELLTHDFFERFGLPYTILRFGSLYGPRADGNNAVYCMLRQALTEQRIEYRGTGQEVREYIHVDDAAAAAAEILVPTYEGQIIHLTGRDRMTTHDMLEMIREIMGGSVQICLSDSHALGHYVQTPYSYTPKLGRKMTRNTYIDLGLGLLDCLNHLDQAARDEFSGPLQGELAE